MPLETFAPTYAPNIGFAETHEPRILTAQFGDGYEQRIPDGVNYQRRQWSLAWGPIPLEVANYIVDFLRARGGYQAFWWTPPRYLAPVKVRCPKWRRAEEQWNASTVEAGFVETFDLDT